MELLMVDHLCLPLWTLHQWSNEGSAWMCVFTLLSGVYSTRPTSSSHWGERLHCLLCGLVVWMGLSAFPRGLVSLRGGCVYSYAGHGRWCVPCSGGSAFVPVWESEMGHLKGWRCLGWWDWVIRNPICFKRLWKVSQPSPQFLHPQPQRPSTITHIPESPHCPETIAQQRSLVILFFWGGGMYTYVFSE